MTTRKRFAVLGLVAMLGLVGAACRPRVAAPPPPVPRVVNCVIGADATAARIVQLANEARAAVGVGPLAWDGQLGCLARDWANHIAVTGSFTHRDLSAVLRDSAYARWSTLGENILRAGESISADGMHQAWMNSSSHRAVLLSASFRYIGFGLVYANGKAHAVQNFGA